MWLIGHSGRASASARHRPTATRYRQEVRFFAGQATSSCRALALSMRPATCRPAPARISSALPTRRTPEHCGQIENLRASATGRQGFQQRQEKRVHCPGARRFSKMRCGRSRSLQSLDRPCARPLRCGHPEEVSEPAGESRRAYELRERREALAKEGTRARSARNERPSRTQSLTYQSHDVPLQSRLRPGRRRQRGASFGCDPHWRKPATECFGFIVVAHLEPQRIECPAPPELRP